MRKINKRQGLMLCAAGLLVLVMLTVFMRLGTTHVLVKRAHIDNFITRTILHGNADLQNADIKVQQEIITWKNTYPFSYIDDDNKKAIQPIKKIESNATSVEKRISEWTGKYLLGYYKLAEAGREYENRIGWGLINPSQEVIPLSDGVWTFIEPKASNDTIIQNKTESLAELAQTVENNGAIFLYSSSS